MKKLVAYDALKTPKKPKGKQERFEELKDEGLRTFVRTLKCLACEVAGYGVVFTPSECAHVTSKGAAGGDWDNLVPLCTRHHQQQHSFGIRSFEFKYQIRLKAAARKVTALYVANRKHG